MPRCVVVVNDPAITAPRVSDRQLKRISDPSTQRNRHKTYTASGTMPGSRDRPWTENSVILAHANSQLSRYSPTGAGDATGAFSKIGPALRRSPHPYSKVYAPPLAPSAALPPAPPAAPPAASRPPIARSPSPLTLPSPSRQGREPFHELRQRPGLVQPRPYWVGTPTGSSTRCISLAPCTRSICPRPTPLCATQWYRRLRKASQALGRMSTVASPAGTLRRSPYTPTSPSTWGVGSRQWLPLRQVGAGYLLQAKRDNSVSQPLRSWLMTSARACNLPQTMSCRVIIKRQNVLLVGA